jgi:hypothetical protein
VPPLVVLFNRMPASGPAKMLIDEEAISAEDIANHVGEVVSCGSNVPCAV